MAAGAAIGGLAGGTALTGTFGTAITWGGTLAGAAVGSMVEGTAYQVRAARQAAKTQEAMYEYNAKVRQQEAAQIRRASLEEQHIRRDDMRRLLAKRRALYAKGGVTMAGSPMEAQLDVVSEFTEDISRMSLAYDIEAKRQLSGAGLETYKAKAAKRAGRLAVGTALFGGLSDIATLGLRYQLQKLGMA
jgi:uncharacterized sporulation protein YeaH/YhbH (DUF444 family)